MKERDPNSDFAGDANEITFGKLGEERLNIYIGMYIILFFMRGCTDCNSLWCSHTLTFTFHITFTYSFLSHVYISTFTHTFILLSLSLSIYIYIYIYIHSLATLLGTLASTGSDPLLSSELS